jgi:GT2 family glycosyltransferase
MISVIIVTYNNSAATLACLKTLFAHHEGNGFEVIVVDNASADGTVNAVRESFPAVTVLAQTDNLGFGAANNIGARAAVGEYLFFLNNDTLFTAPVLDELAAVLSANGDASAVAPRLVNVDGSFQVSTGYTPSLRGERRTKQLQKACDEKQADALSAAQGRKPDWVTAAAIMISTSAFKKIVGFDERFFMYFEDVDLCVRLRAEAGVILYEPSISIIHIGGGSWKSEQTQSDRIRGAYRHSQLLFYAKHHGVAQNILIRCFLGVKFAVRALVLRDAGAARLLRTVFTTPDSLLHKP